MSTIYLDYNASTPLDPDVIEAMRPFLEASFGNPSSAHWAGRPAREAVELARGRVAELIGAAPAEVVFTSGGTEASNHALKGAWYRAGRADGHFITTAVEHPATLNPLRFLEGQGAEVTVLPVDHEGRVDPNEVRRAIQDRTVLVSVMHANNEIGTIEPIEEIGRITRERGILFHVDAAQSLGKIPVDVNAMGADLVSIAGHKLYAPKGVGALYIRAGVELEPLMHGAGHESGRRAGTENVLLAVGLGAACAAAQRWLASEGRSGPSATRALRDRLHFGLEQALPDQIVLNGHPDLRLPNTLNVCFRGRDGAELLAKLDGVAASTGSACHAGSIELSPVLRAIGVDPELGRGAVRFSLGRATTADEIDEVVARLRALRA